MKEFSVRFLILLLLFGISGIVRQTPAMAGTADKETIPEFGSAKSLECQKNEECILIDTKVGWGCCGAGSCGYVDYSLEQWIAVNIEWLEEGRTKYCPPKEECGPRPMCAVRIPLNFAAQCIHNLCQKVSK